MTITTYSSSKLPRFTQILAIIYHPYLCLWLMDLNISQLLNQLDASKFKKNGQKRLEIAFLPQISGEPGPVPGSAVAHDGRGTHRRGKAQRQGQRAIQQPCHQHHGKHQQQGANAAAKAWNAQKKKNSKKLGSTVNVFRLFSLTCQCSKIYVQSFLFFEVYSKCLSTGLSTTGYTNIYSYLLYVSVAKCRDSIQPSTLHLHPP